MSPSYAAEALKARFPADFLADASARGEEAAVLRPGALAAAAAFLKEELAFDMLMDLTVVDRLPAEPRYELVCHLYSTSRNARLRLKCPVPAADPAVDSLTPVWPGAAWFEREAWDMFGVDFKGNPDLRRLLMYDGFEGHPLRKDYPIGRRQPRREPAQAKGAA